MESQKKMTERPCCANGCDFYGSVETKNLCSRCYRDYLKQESRENMRAESAMVALMNNLDRGSVAGRINPLPSLKASNSVSPSVAVAGCSKSSSGSTSVKNRCESCNRKVGVLGFSCRCGGVFCGTHRYPEKHCCHVDFKMAGRDVLAKQNPLCKGDKLECRI
ncbi:hypothetical protein ACFX2I_027647 [Malus domestica]|uniref:putative zinc finger A20 and AN1 domain-containing stress-associated protein 8 n=1 Tax=Malus domestica TaxID=3750 RepID=UPI0010AB35FB|nr:zinc finger A20 and AN1 domain-containing stress-associated protein 5-like [Malus domestica]